MAIRTFTFSGQVLSENLHMRVSTWHDNNDYIMMHDTNRQLKAIVIVNDFCHILHLIETLLGFGSNITPLLSYSYS